MDEKRPKVQWLNETCAICGNKINSWDLRVSKALGYKTKHLCEKCIAKEYDVEVEELRSICEHHFGMIPCLGI